MVTLNEEMTIASPLDAVWPLLRDPAVVAGCIPGAQLSADSEDEVWRGSIRIKFGPTIAMFRGEATLAFDDAAKRITLDGRGIDGRGASRALASSVVALHAGGTNSTTMKVEGEFTVTGPLETFVNAGGVHVARALLSDFCTNIAAAIAAPAQDGADASASAAADSHGESQTAAQTAAIAGPGKAGTQSAPSPLPKQPIRQATELRAGALLWRALLGWMKSPFNKGKRSDE